MLTRRQINSAFIAILYQQIFFLYKKPLVKAATNGEIIALLQRQAYRCE
jgi:hypothetical protein